MQKLTKKQKDIIKEQALTIHKYRKSIRLFVKDMWGLEPQPIKPEYAQKLKELELSSYKNFERLKNSVKAEWWGGVVGGGVGGQSFFRWDSFTKGKHFTWQQNLILMGIEKNAQGNALNFLSIVSGHGIGKSASCAWITLWFLYCYYNSQVAVTAPTSSQMHDVLWKEMSIWISKMPEDIANMYDWTRDYIRMNYAPTDWFARARTSSKENTEAIAGVHSESGVAIIVDEASGVPEKVFETMLGALTSKKVLIILISNGTRPLGYFYDSHHRNKEDWQTFRFSSEESPIVDKKYIETISKQFGIDSEEYRIRVKGMFPDLGNMDTTGYMQLMSRNKITIRLESEDSIPFIGRNILGVDPSGEGKDKTVFVLRDQFKAKVIHERNTSNSKEIAEDILTFIDRYSIDPMDVVVDSFGVGADVSKEVAIASGGRYRIYSVLIGNTPKFEEEYNSDFFERHEDEVINPEGEYYKWKDLYLNIRALAYFRIKKWIITGGELSDVSVDNSDFVDEIIVNRYKRTLQSNQIKMMPKNEMMKMGIRSTNYSDALSLSMLRDLAIVNNVDRKSRLSKNNVVLLNEQKPSGDDRFSAV